MSSSLVSCLCVTEGRPAFMPWLLWNFDRQTYPKRELIIVDSSPEPLVVDRPDVRVLRAPPGTNVPAKRNLALDACQGDMVAWFDDDDWQHPERLTKLVAALNDRYDYAGTSHAWFIDLHGTHCAPYYGHGALIFNGAGFAGALARSVRFNEGVRKASDTVWLRDLGARRPRLALLEDRLTIWLCHDANISNSRGRRRFPSPLSTLKQALGEDAWADTDERLEALRDTLPAPLLEPRSFRRSADADDDEVAPPMRRSAVLGGRSRLQRAETRGRAPEVMHVDTAATGRPGRLASAPVGGEPALTPSLESEKPEVSLVVLAEPRHLDQLDALAQHLFQQSKYAFAERLLLIESERGCPLPAPGTAGFERILPVNERAEARSAVQKYLAPGADGSAPSRALRELDALEHGRSDWVLFCRAGVLFHASGGSWVREAIQRMKADPTLWATTTHPGPPAGPIGHPRGWPPGVGQKPQWDRRLRLWRSREAFPSYCLVEKKRLFGALSGVGDSLVETISRALPAHGAYHGSVASKGSWALDATRASLPSDDWLAPLAALVTEGTFPGRQKGRFELELEEPATSEAWGRLVNRGRSANAA